MPEKLVRFGLAGFLSVPVHYVSLVVLVEVFGVGAVVGTAVGSALGAWANYAANRKFTFKSAKRHREAFPRFLVVAGATGLLNVLLVYVGVDLLGFHYVIVQVIVTVTVFLLNFLLHKSWSFGEAGTI